MMMTAALRNPVNRRMMNRIPWLILAGLVFALPQVIMAQEEDFSIWTSIDLEKKLNKNLEFSAGMNLRTEQNTTRLASLFPEIGLEYRTNDLFRFKAKYRGISGRTQGGSWVQGSRLNLGINAQRDIADFQLRLDAEYQYEIDHYLIRDGSLFIDGDNYARYKLSLKYDLNKSINLYIGAELFHLLLPGRSGLEAVRLNAGIKYRFDKSNSIKISYLIDKEFNQLNPASRYILNIGYVYKIPRSKKDKEDEGQEELL